MPAETVSLDVLHRVSQHSLTSLSKISNVQNFSIPASFNTLHISQSGFLSGHAAGAIHAHFFHGFFDPDGADHIDTDSTRHFQGGSPRETIEAGVHRTDGCAARHGLAGQKAAGQSERPVVIDIRQSQADEIDLSHELVIQAEAEIFVAEFSQCTEFRQPGRAD